MEVSCIACGGGRVTDLGPLPNFTPALRGQAGAACPTGSLYRCHDCTLRFRAPLPKDEELMSHYEGLSGDDWWQYESEREVWHHVRDLLRDVPERSVLDVGCFRGDLLKFLGGGWELFGVEPSADARREARSRGVNVIGDNVDSLRGETRRFGAITLIDVIEHLPRPLDALRTLSRLLLPGGRLVVFTGSTDAWTWRFAKLHYWYCAMPEHVAFFRPSWFRWAAPRLGCAVDSVRRLAYQPSPPRTRLTEALYNIVYAAYHRLEEWPVLPRLLRAAPFVSRVGSWESCWWTSARDHILVSLSKEG
jgi:SAM-dependent methyltransferase